MLKTQDPLILKDHRDSNSTLAERISFSLGRHLVSYIGRGFAELLMVICEAAPNGSP